MTTQEILEAARSAKSALALADNTARNAALLGMADALCDAQNQSAILAANAEDMAAAKGHISDVMLDRLALTAGHPRGCRPARPGGPGAESGRAPQRACH